MPQSKTRKKKSPNRTAAPVPHPMAAEATDGVLGFVFRGHLFTIDYGTADFGKALFALRLAERGGNLASQFGMLLDCVEAVLGEEQVRTVYEIAPDLFSSESAQREFWGQFAEMTVGASLGEQSAS